MKQKKSLFLEIIIAISLLVILMGNFMGLLYILNGNAIFSLLASVVMTILYFFIIKYLIEMKEVMYREKFLHISSLLWLPLLLLSGLSFYLTSHFLNIENHKIEIQNEVNYKLALVESFIFSSKSRVNTNFQDYQIDLVKQGRNHDVAKSIIKAQRKPIDEGIEKLNDSISSRNSDLKNVFYNWNYFSLVSDYNNLNNYIKSTLNSVNLILTKLPTDKSNLSLPNNLTSLPLNNPKEFKNQFPPDYMLPFLVILVTNIIILIPFFLQKIGVYDRGPEPDGAIIL